MHKTILSAALLAVLLLYMSASTHASMCDSDGICKEKFSQERWIGIEFQEPDVTPLQVYPDLLHDRWYRQVNGRVEVYDSPNGTVVRVIENGLNYVTVLSDQDGWTKINENEFVLSEYLQDTNGIISQFSGVLLPETGLEFTMAWALVNLYPSPEPGSDPSERFDLVPRYTRLNIYLEETFDGEEWYMIGPGQWVHQFHVAKINPLQTIPDSVDTDLWVGIDLYEQVAIAYDGDKPIFATLVSTGLPRWPTYEGTFHIYYRNPREYMSWGTVGDDFYSLEEVPWTMFFDAGRAIHGTYWHDGLGYRRSHGCVNMSITDAYWIYNWVAESMGKHRSADIEEGPAVYVYSSGQYE